MSDCRKESQAAIRPKAWNEHQDTEAGKDSHGIDGMDVTRNEEHEAEAGMEDSTEASAEDRSLGLEEPSVFRQETDEELAPRGMRAPSVPNAAERESHERTHCPARSWCEHCVRGQAKDTKHISIEGVYADSTIARVSLDYCYLTEDVRSTEASNEKKEIAKTSLTVLVMMETMCRSVWGYVCSAKGGSEEWLVDQIIEDMETIGLAEERIIVKTDQESSMTDIQNCIAKKRAKHGTAIENSRVGDSNSNAKVERAIQDLEGLARTLRSDLESKTKSKIRLEDPIVPWLVRHAGHLITICRVRDNGRTAFQMMKGRRTNMRLVPFGENVMFKIPKTTQRTGKFEDRWESGCWVGFVMRTGEHLIATSGGVFKVSTVMRRPADQRWSETLIKEIKGSPEEPIPGMSGRRILAYAKKYQQEPAEKVAYVPAQDAEVDPRKAKVQTTDVDEHGPTEKCPGCRAHVNGKYRSKHTDECRQRFERILSQTAKGRQRFEAATERRLNAITKKAMEMQDQIEKKAATMSAGGSGASGSGLTAAARAAGVDDQNKRDMEKGIEISKGEKRKANDELDDEQDKREQARTEQSTDKSTKGTKRKSEEDDADAVRMQDREATNQQGTAEDTAKSAGTSGTKRRADDNEQIDESRTKDRGSDMSSMTTSHPGQIHSGGKYAKGDLEWKNIGSGVFAKTFIKATRLLTTTKNGPPMQAVHRRTIRSLSTGKIIDDCIVDNTKDSELNRRLSEADDIRIELTMKGALHMYGASDNDVSEIFSQPRIAQEAAVRSYSGMTIKPGWSLDLTREDPATGKRWDLNKREVRERVRELIRTTDPFLVVGSPPCTMFCALQNLSRDKRNQEEYQEKLRIAKKQMQFCMEIYQMQMDRGKFFLHEHPDSATSWKLQEVQKMMNHRKVRTVKCDMCTFGMEATDKEGTALVRKRTKLMSNSSEILKRIESKCTNEAGAAKHRHADITGGQTRQCQVYPRAFCKKVCEGIAAQKKLYDLGMTSEPLMSLQEMQRAVPSEKSTGDPSKDLHESEGEFMAFTMKNEFMLLDGTVAYDDQSGARLKPELTRKARLEEIEYFRAMEVYEKVPIEECWEQTGQAPIATRWIDVNKGDTARPNYRSRLVAKEFKTDINPELYAATPPSESLRLIISKLASNRKMELMYADVSRAYFYAKAVRAVYVKLPEEDQEEGDAGKCGRLKMSMYGTRDAALNWASEYSGTLLAAGFERGKANPCLFWNPKTDVSIFVHGDDFVAVGNPEFLKETQKTLEDKYKLKVENLGNKEGQKTEVKILNKIVRHTDRGIELEADPRHAEIVIKELGLEDAKATRVPGTKAPKGEDKKKGACEDETEDEGPEEEEDLSPEEATKYRALAARLNYLAVDRVDIQYSVKEAARAMSCPKEGHWTLLRRIGKYLRGTPRLVMKFPWQSPQSVMTTYTDSDWAGCLKTARSTSGGVITMGGHMIRSWSRQQKVVALSSAEAELYAMVAASAECLGLIAYARDLGMTMSGEIYADSSAALGIAQRCGIGKVRHLRTQSLWVQEVRLTKRLTYKKVLGTKNPADILTKYVPAELLKKHLATLGTAAVGGRADAAPELCMMMMEVVKEWEEPLNTSGPKDKQVRFATKVRLRSIPSANRGRRCDKVARKELQGTKRKEAVRSEASQEEAKTERKTDGLESGRRSNPILEKPRWADEFDHHEGDCE